MKNYLIVRSRFNKPKIISFSILQDHHYIELDKYLQKSASYISPKSRQCEFRGFLHLAKTPYLLIAAIKG